MSINRLRLKGFKQGMIRLLRKLGCSGLGNALLNRGN